MKTIKELKDIGFEETFVSGEESGDFPFQYLSFKTKQDIHLISDDYSPDTDENTKIKIFFFEGNNGTLSDNLIEQLVK